MTVRELVEKLSKMPQNAQVCFPDTYVREEGCSHGHEKAVCIIAGVAKFSKRQVIFLSEDDIEWSV